MVQMDLTAVLNHHLALLAGWSVEPAEFFLRQIVAYFVGKACRAAGKDVPTTGCVILCTAGAQTLPADWTGCVAKQVSEHVGIA